MKHITDKQIMDWLERTIIISFAIMGIAAIAAAIWASKPHAGFEGAAMLLFAYIWTKGEKGGDHDNG